MSEAPMSRSGTALLLHEPPKTLYRPLYAAIASTFDPDVYRIGLDDPMPDLSGYRLIISRLKFRHMAARASMGWEHAPGLKVHWDEDGYADGLWSGSEFEGLYSQHLPRLGIDLLVVTGMRTRDHFADRGIESVVLNKSYDAASFRDLSGPRSDTMVMYGQEYPSRVISRAALLRAGVPVEHVRVPFGELSDTLNRYQAALTSMLDTTAYGGRLGRRLSRRFPWLVSGTEPGPEPMIKLFEAAAAGCAPFTDLTPDLEHLGFVDGVNAVIYRTLDELVEKALHYQRRPDELRAIGARAAVLVAENHTHEHRCKRLAEILADRLARHAA